MSEVQLVNPVLLVAMGTKVFEVLRGLDRIDVPIERVTHHGYLARQNTRSSAEEKLKLELARVRRVYERL